MATLAAGEARLEVGVSGKVGKSELDLAAAPTDFHTATALSAW